MTVQSGTITDDSDEAVARIGQASIHARLWSMRILAQVVALPFALASAQMNLKLGGLRWHCHVAVGLAVSDLQP
jgi:hypothetical protein